jgi:hypothetical protein
MARRIFIVARGNVAVHKSLTQALRREQDLEIIFDRRQEQSKRSDLGEAIKKVFSRGTPPPSAKSKEERRRRARIDEQIRTQGWAVVSEEGTDTGLDQAAAKQYQKLRSVWSDPRLREADPVLAVLMEYRGICLDCLAEKVKLALDEVMVAVRRTRGDVLLAFVTRPCVVCSRKSLVSFIRDRVVADGPGTPAGSGKAGAADDDHAAEHEVAPASSNPGGRRGGPQDETRGMPVRVLSQRSSALTSGHFGAPASRQAPGDASRAQRHSPAAALDLHELDGRRLVLRGDNDTTDTAPHAEPPLDGRQLRHVGMILKLAEVEGGVE